MLEYNLQKCIIMEQIKLASCDTLESAVYTLLAAKARVQHVWCEFNEHKLYSDKVTMDSAYLEVIGRTKKEYDQQLLERLEQFEKALQEAKLEEGHEAQLVLESKKKYTLPITQELVIAGLKFIAENQTISQKELTAGLLELGCNFTLEDIENQVTTPETSLFTGMSRGDLAYGASVIANARKDFLSRAYVSEKFLSVDNNTSIYNYIRIVTGDMKYTKDKIDSMNAEHKLSKKLK